MTLVDAWGQSEMGQAAIPPESTPRGCPPEEAALIRSAQRGDEKAITVLLMRYETPLRTFVQSRAQADSRLDADDALGRIRETAWRNLHRFDFAYDFRSYIFGIAYYAVLPPRRREHDDIEDLDPPAPTRAVPSAAARELLEILIRCGGYPHQQVTMLHSVVLWGRSKPRVDAAKLQGAAVGGSASDAAPSRYKVPVTGDPDRVVVELEHARLGEAADAAEADLASTADWGVGFLPRCFEPLRTRLALLGRALFARDGQSARFFEHVLETIVSKTSLSDYFGPDPRRSVANWTDGVKERTRRALLGEFDCRRCPLPCSERSR